MYAINTFTDNNIFYFERTAQRSPCILLHVDQIWKKCSSRKLFILFYKEDYRSLSYFKCAGGGGGVTMENHRGENKFKFWTCEDPTLLFFRSLLVVYLLIGVARDLYFCQTVNPRKHFVSLVVFFVAIPFLKRHKDLFFFNRQRLTTTRENCIILGQLNRKKTKIIACVFNHGHVLLTLSHFISFP